MKTWMLATIDGVSSNDSALVPNHCSNVMRGIRGFERVVLFSFQKPSIRYNHEFIKIPKLDKYGYALWSIRELCKHINTDYVLTIHPDGYIINPNLWSEEFLDYDYIGAPWQVRCVHNKNYRVGNSGFCIRSKKFCQMTSDCPVPYMLENDDVYFCQAIRGTYMPHEMYAPKELAARFSLEWDDSFGFSAKDVFGFHGFTEHRLRRKLNHANYGYIL